MKLRISLARWNYTYADGIQSTRIYALGMWTPIIVLTKRTTYREALADKLDEVRKLCAELGKDGNWNYDPHTHGRWTAAETILALLEEREPDHRPAPDTWMRDLRLIHGLPGFGAADLSGCHIEWVEDEYDANGFPKIRAVVAA